MFAAQMLLTLALAADSIFVEHAQVSWTGDDYALEIAGEVPVGNRAASPSLLGRILVVAVDATKVHENKRTWGEGNQRVRSHRHDDFTELSVPLPTGAVCTGSPQIGRTSAGGVRATLKCAAPDAVRKQWESGLAVVKAPVVAAKPVVAKPTPVADLRRSVALEPEVAPAVVPTVAVEKVAAKPEVAKPVVVKAPAPTKPEPVAAVAKPVPPAPVQAPLAKQPAPLASRDLTVVAVPLVGLVLLAAIALFRGRTVKGRGKRLLRIVETASLGPKRSLIIAEIGGERLVLGSSEAGISLLRRQNDESDVAPQVKPPAAPVKAAPEPTATDDISITVDVESDEDRGQAGVLNRLFGRKSQKSPAQDFASLLDDSMEDRELRAKLAAGFSGRVA